MTLRTIEKGKDAAILLLLILAILLTSIKFNLFAFSSTASQDQKPLSISLDQTLRLLVLPSSIWIHFGGGNTTKAPAGDQRYYTEVRQLLRDTIKPGQKPALQSRWDVEKLKATRSMEIRFQPAIDSEVLSRSLSLASPLDSLPPIDEIFIPLVGQSTIFFISKEQVWSLESQKINTLSLVDNLETNGNYYRYYTLQNLYPSSTSQKLISLEDRTGLPSYRASVTLDQQNKEKLAKFVFQQKYDFLNQILQNDGTLIYAYNYGKEMLTLAANGRIQYASAEIPPSQTEKLGALLKAANFMESIQLYLPSMRLYSIEKTTFKERPAYEIQFHYTLDSYPIYGPLASENIKATVCGDRVVNFSGYPLLLGSKAELPDFQPRNVEELLDLQYNSLKETLFLQGPEDFFAKIMDLRRVYYLKEDSHLVPAFQLNMDGKIFFYNYYTGEELR